MNQENKLGYWEGLLSIIFNTLLFILKFWVGIISGSIAIIADAWHTLSDSFSSIILLLGFKLSAKPADKNHPFGHGRAELIASVIIGVILAVVGFNFLMESIQRFKGHQAAHFGTLAIIATSISIVMKEAMAQFAFWAARKSKSELLKADGWHHRCDALSSVIVLIGIFLGKYWWWIDSVMGLIIAFTILHATYNILKSSISHLLGEEADQETVNTIIELIKSNIKQPINLHHLHIHHYGHHKEITFHIMLDGNLSLKQAHEVADCIEKLLREELNIEATIHCEPLKLA